MNQEIELLASSSAEKDESIELLAQRLEAAHLYAEDSERTAISQSAQVAHVANIANRESDVARELRGHVEFRQAHLQETEMHFRLENQMLNAA